jgi:muramidase (phage lysozyme)
VGNLDAFLTAIAVSEGTDSIGNRGYDCIVGSRPGRAILFHNYRDHPRIKVQLSENLWSSAAGRYQILERYFDAYKESLRLPDFSPRAQDAIATQMIREQHALEDVNAGRIDIAIAKCANVWASLPGPENTYQQHQQSLAFLQNAYKSAGGSLV